MISAFVHIEKTGGTSLIEAVRSATAFGHCDIIPKSQTSEILCEEDLRLAKKIYPRLSSLAGHSIRPHCSFGSLSANIRLYTILRPGVARFVSDFNHDRVKRGYRGSFIEWAEFDDRKNFQVRAIAGREDLDLAMQILTEKFALVGVTEHYDAFWQRAVELLSPIRVTQTPLRVNVAGTRYGSIHEESDRGPRPIRLPDLTQGERALAEDKNRLDQALYDFAKSHLAPITCQALEARERSQPGRIFQLLNRTGGRLWRNAVYKPATGRMPFSVHALPRNAVNSEIWYDELQKNG